MMMRQERQESAHAPVMLAEVLEALAPRDGAIYLDGTFGRGGYARAILEAADCRVVGLDRDPDAIAAGIDMEREFAGRLHLLEGRFGDMEQLCEESAVDGVALDLGVSSPQLDEAERGFSFRVDGPLDMRMGREGRSAADVVNQASEAQLSDIIWRLGEERRARQVARAIVEARQEAPITRTLQLAEIVRSVVKPSADGIDPATRTFQALRLYVNDELEELQRGLEAARGLLAPGGRLAVVSFHSLEDRMVKQFLRRHSGAAPRASRHAPLQPEVEPSFELLFRQARRPSAEESRANPRARSARLRAAVRTAATVRRPDDPGRGGTA